MARRLFRPNEDSVQIPYKPRFPLPIAPPTRPRSVRRGWAAEREFSKSGRRQRPEEQSRIMRPLLIWWICVPYRPNQIGCCIACTHLTSISQSHSAWRVRDLKSSDRCLPSNPLGTNQVLEECVFLNPNGIPQQSLRVARKELPSGDV